MCCLIHCSNKNELVDRLWFRLLTVNLFSIEYARTCLSLSWGILVSTPSGNGLTSSGFSLILSMMKSRTTMMPSTEPVIRHARSVVPADKRQKLSFNLSFIIKEESLNQNGQSVYLFIPTKPSFQNYIVLLNGSADRDKTTGYFLVLPTAKGPNGEISVNKYGALTW